jgi:hypothetical protein
MGLCECVLDQGAGVAVVATAWIFQRIRLHFLPLCPVLGFDRRALAITRTPPQIRPFFIRLRTTTLTLMQ